MQIGPYPVGQVLEKYESALVYAARLDDGQPALLTAIMPTSSESARRIYARLDIIRNLQHPGILPLINDGQTADATFYIVFQYLPPVLPPNGSLPVDTVLSMSTQVSAALDYAHEQGLVHDHIDRAHVVHGADGRIYLRGFELASDEHWPDPAHPSEDITALVRLVYQALTGRQNTEHDFKDMPRAVASVLRHGIRGGFSTSGAFHMAFEKAVNALPIWDAEPGLSPAPISRADHAPREIRPIETYEPSEIRPLERLTPRERRGTVRLGVLTVGLAIIIAGITTAVVLLSGYGRTQSSQSAANVATITAPALVVVVTEPATATAIPTKTVVPTKAPTVTPVPATATPQPSSTSRPTNTDVPTATVPVTDIATETVSGNAMAMATSAAPERAVSTETVSGNATAMATSTAPERAVSNVAIATDSATTAATLAATSAATAIATSAAADAYVFAKGNVAMRSGPDTDFLPVTALKPGTPLAVLARTKDKTWIQVKSGDITGWVNSALLIVNVNLDSVAVVTADEIAKMPMTNDCVTVVGDSVAHGDAIFEFPDVGYAFVEFEPMATYIDRGLKAAGIPDTKAIDRGVSGAGISFATRSPYVQTKMYKAMITDRCKFTIILPWVSDLSHSADHSVDPIQTAPAHVTQLTNFVQDLIKRNPYGRVLIVNYYPGAPNPFVVNTFAKGFTSAGVTQFNMAMAAACTSGDLSKAKQVSCVDSNAVFGSMGTSYVIGSITRKELEADIKSPLDQNELDWLNAYTAAKPDGLLIGDGIHLNAVGKEALAKYLVQVMQTLPDLHMDVKQ